jgi:hypothetical protein
MSHNKHIALDVTIRYAFPDDAPAIAKLAVLDSSSVPEGVLIVAEVGGELWAARSLTARGAIADPFRPSADAAALLDARAAQLKRGSGPASVFEPAAWLRAVLPDG